MRGMRWKQAADSTYSSHTNRHMSTVRVASKTISSATSLRDVSKQDTRPDIAESRRAARRASVHPWSAVRRCVAVWTTTEHSLLCRQYFVLHGERRIRRSVVLNAGTFSSDDVHVSHLRIIGRGPNCDRFLWAFWACVFTKWPYMVKPSLLNWFEEEWRKMSSQKPTTNLDYSIEIFFAQQLDCNVNRGVLVRQQIHVHCCCLWNAFDEAPKISSYVDVRCYDKTK